MAHVIVVGNEKGGAGKSTVSMHVATALARSGHRVGVIDLDLRQRTTGRYIENRMAHMAEAGLDLASPRYLPLPEIDPGALAPGETASDRRLARAVEILTAENDFLLIDCPGSHTRLAQAAHAMADTLITPLNDSFVDFDLLARIAPDGERIQGPSVYSEMVWAARQMRARNGAKPIDWIVLRNRLGSQAMVNKAKMERALDRLARRIGFRVGPGFSERVVFRELFPRGLTLLDLGDVGVRQLNMSNIAARQELRDLVRALDLPGVEVGF
ncbi:division plane positioning ATPase MipZ [Roseivivax sp. CAU 1761]